LAEFGQKDRIRARPHRRCGGTVDSFELEFAPILPVASASGENFVVQVRNDAGFPKPPLVVGLRFHQMERSVASESNQRSRDARSAAAMHAQHQNGDRTWAKVYLCLANPVPNAKKQLRAPLRSQSTPN